MAVLTLGEDSLISICADIFTCLPANAAPLIITNAELGGRRMPFWGRIC